MFLLVWKIKYNSIYFQNSDFLIRPESIWHRESQVVTLWEGWQARIRGCRRSYISTESIWHRESLVVTVWECGQARIRGYRRSYVSSESIWHRESLVVSLWEGWQARIRGCRRSYISSESIWHGESLVVTVWEGWQARIRGCRRSYKCRVRFKVMCSRVKALGSEHEFWGRLLASSPTSSQNRDPTPKPIQPTSSNRTHKCQSYS